MFVLEASCDCGLSYALPLKTVQQMDVRNCVLSDGLYLRMGCNMFLLWSSIFLNVVNVVILEKQDVRYSCVCGTDSSGIVRNEINHFLSMVEDMLCCGGKPECKLQDDSLPTKENEHRGSLMMCFSDASCVTKKSINADCTNHSRQCFSNAMELYNVSNDSGYNSVYKCIILHAEDKYSLCVLPVCDTFAFVRRVCNCSINSTSCICSSLSDHDAPWQMNAIFFSFADKYVTVKNKFLTALFASILGVLLLTVLLTLIFTFRKYFKLFPVSFIARRLHPSGNTAALDSCSSNAGNAKCTYSLQEGSITEVMHPLPAYDEVIKSGNCANAEPPPSYTMSVGKY